MIVHVVDIRESGPDGLIAVLDPHESERSTAAEARLVSEAHRIDCAAERCDRWAGAEIVVHRRHSRRPSETAYLCNDHLADHRAGGWLRLRMESNR